MPYCYEEQYSKLKRYCIFLALLSLKSQNNVNIAKQPYAVEEKVRMIARVT